MKAFKQRIIGDNERVKRFRIMLSAFLACLLIPLALIIYYGLQQLDNEMEFQYQLKSVNTLKHINKKLNSRVKTERKRPVSHYNFYQVVVNPLTGQLSEELSPLSNPENYPDNLGIIGYFQINTDKTLSSPLLPYQTRSQIKQANTRFQWPEIERRILVKQKIKEILIENDFVINTDNDASIKTSKKHIPTTDVKTESFQVKITKHNELILFRNVWVDQQHKTQGFIVEFDTYLQSTLMDYFVQGHFAQSVQIRLRAIHSEQGILQYFKYSNNNGKPSVELLDKAEPELENKYIYHSYIITPFQKLQLKFTTDNYPLGSASKFVVFFLIVLVLVIVLGCLGFYWVGIKQIELAEQRMNFVSSVSHELKTPLTSILMYAEMLKSGMVQNSQTQREYHEFIFGESDRLSRLISNILKLSNLNRQQEMVNVEYVSILSLQDTIQSKVSSLIEKNAFVVNFYIDEKINHNAEMLVDLDAFAQIVINLIDNSVKFFNAAKIEDKKRRQIDISFAAVKKGKNQLTFSVRDYGPGISTSEQNRIFELFYREGNEMTRTTPGTGIGLALVNELVIAQGGEISVNTKEQGVEFEVLFEGRNLTLDK